MPRVPLRRIGRVGYRSELRVVLVVAAVAVARGSRRLSDGSLMAAVAAWLSGVWAMMLSGQPDC